MDGDAWRAQSLCVCSVWWYKVCVQCAGSGGIPCVHARCLVVQDMCVQCLVVQCMCVQCLVVQGVCVCVHTCAPVSSGTRYVCAVSGGTRCRWVGVGVCVCVHAPDCLVVQGMCVQCLVVQGMCMYVHSVWWYIACVYSVLWYKLWVCVCTHAVSGGTPFVCAWCMVIYYMCVCSVSGGTQHVCSVQCLVADLYKVRLVRLKIQIIHAWPKFTLYGNFHSSQNFE